MEDKKLKELLKKEKESREKKDIQKSISILKEIIEFIKNKNEDNKYDILSTLFLYQDQSNYIKIYILNELIKDQSFVNNKNTKKKYYQLLVDSFDKNTTKDHQMQTTKIKELFEKSESSGFDELDMYIDLFLIESGNKDDNLDNFEEDITNRELFSNLDNKKNFNIKIPGNNNYLNDNNNSNMPISPISLNPNSPLDRLNKPVFDEFPSKIPEDIISSENNVNNEKNILKKYKPNQSLPMVVLSVSVNMNSFQFLVLINQTFKKYNYTNIETLKDTEFENLKIYEYTPKNCCDYITEIINTKGKCIHNQFYVYSNLKRDEDNFSSGISTILKDTYEKKISIKSIKGIESNIINFMIQFLKTFCQSIERVKIIKQSNCFNKYNLEQELNDVIQLEREIKISSNMNKKLFNFKNKAKNKYRKLRNEDDSMLGLNTMNKSLNSNITTTETFKYLEIFRILSKSEYGLGKKINDFIEEFKKKYSPPLKNVKEIDTREIMVNIIKLFEFCTSNLNTSFNNKNNAFDVNYLSTASEQYIFNKIYFILFNIYSEKYKEDNINFIKIQNEINEKLSCLDICNKLQVQSIYLGKEKDPFKSVINIINQIPFEKFLHKKFEILTQASLEIRKCILEYTDGKFELESMDDELPIIIFITTQVKVNNLLAELNMIDDYIKCSMRDNLVQNKMVTNLLSSVMYLSKSWKKETQSFD